MTSTVDNSLLSAKEVVLRLKIGRSSLYDRINVRSPRFDKTFPRPINIGPGSVRWISTEIDAWLQGRVEERERLLTIHEVPKATMAQTFAESWRAKREREVRVKKTT